MNKKIIVIEGYLASGKSTFALQLAKKLNIPYFIKDTFKIALCKNITIANRDESSRFSIVTFDAMIYVAERMLETGYPIIIEGNFVPAGIKKIDESKIISKLINKYGYTSLTFKFVGDTNILHRRFIERERTPERGQVNTMGFEPSCDDFNKWCHNLDAFDIGGKTIVINTTDFSSIDFNKHFENALTFIDA